VDRTDGVPLFIEELTKSVVEGGLLTDAGDRYAMVGPLGPVAIPTTLHASLLARLDRLAPTRELAQIGAALGQQFSHELISAVAQMPQHEVDGALMQLLRAELIFQHGAPPDAEYTFKHALVQDATYGTLLRSRRQQIHARIATTLECKFPEIVAAQPEVLARHCAEAGAVDKAIGYWLQAGQQAIARSAMTEAVAQLRKGLLLLSTAPAGTTRQKQELDLQISLGHALIATKGYSAPEPGDAYARARQLCEQLDEPTQLVPILYGQWVFRLLRGELDKAQRHAKEMHHLGRARNDKMWKCFGSIYSGNTDSFLGKFIDARAHTENALFLWDPVYRRAFVSSPADPYTSGLAYLSRTLLCLGHVDQSHFRRDEALAEARRLSPFTLVHTLCLAWYGNWAERGETTPAMLRSADEVLAIAGEQGFMLWVGFGNVMRGWCLSTMGRTAEGIALLQKGLATCRAAGASLAIPFFLTMLAEAYRIASQPQQGLGRLAEAAKLVETTHERWAEAEIHRLRGTLLLSICEHAAAEASFRQALSVAREQEAKFWELRAATSLARLWCDQDRHIEARDLLAPVYGWFTEGFDTPVLQDAKALLDELA
jgi:predicted ATPase